MDAVKTGILVYVPTFWLSFVHLFSRQYKKTTLKKERVSYSNTVLPTLTYSAKYPITRKCLWKSLWGTPISNLNFVVGAATLATCLLFKKLKQHLIRFQQKDEFLVGSSGGFFTELPIAKNETTMQSRNIRHNHSLKQYHIQEERKPYWISGKD